jgi:hypothetical protein
MKRILDARSRRQGFDGWVMCVKPPGHKVWHPLDWTFCTTRKECRELTRPMQRNIFDKYQIKKAKLKVETVV